MSKEFTADDLVYYPTMGTQVFQLDACRGLDCLPLCIRFDGDEGVFVAFTSTGLVHSTDQLPKIFHATEENHALLEKLYGVEFEVPPDGPIKPTSREIVRALLDKGNKYVPCWVSDRDKNPTHINMWVCICFVKDIKHDGCFLDANDDTWTYATPFDLKTGKEITELPQ